MTMLSADAAPGRLADAGRAALASVLGSLRAEGLELDAGGRTMLAAMAEGTMSADAVCDTVLTPYRLAASG